MLHPGINVTMERLRVFGDIDVCLRTGMHGADRGRKRLRTDRKYLKQICDLRTRVDPRGARKVI